MKEGGRADVARICTGSKRKQNVERERGRVGWAIKAFDKTGRRKRTCGKEGPLMREEARKKSERDKEVQKWIRKGRMGKEECGDRVRELEERKCAVCF